MVSLGSNYLSPNKTVHLTPIQALASWLPGGGVAWSEREFNNVQRGYAWNNRPDRRYGSRFGSESLL